MIVPLGEAPDEVPHFAYVQYLVEHQRLPAHEGATLGESHQPPLSYIVGALATFWIPQSDFQVIANPDYALEDLQAPNLLLHTRREAFPDSGWTLAWRIIRWLSVAMGAVTVWATWQLAREIFPVQSWIALGAAGFVAFLPEFLVVRASVNNDNLNVMLVSLGILLNVRMMQRPLDRRGDALLGILLGLAVLAKLSGLVLWIFTAEIYLYRAWKNQAWKRVAISAGLCFAVGLVFLVPWLIYAQIEYGDPLGWSLILSTTPTRQTPVTLASALFYLRGLFTGFWGRFGGMTQIEMPGGLYAALGALSLLSLTGWLVYARQVRHKKHDPKVGSLLALACAFWAPLLVAHLRFSISILGTDQGRQLFSGLSLLAPLLVVGLSRFLGKFAAILWSGGLFMLSLIMLLYLHVIYSPPMLDPLSKYSLGRLDVPIDFGKTIRVIDYRVDKTQISPGDSINVEFYWQALNPSNENYWLLLQLDGKETVAAKSDGVPSAGRRTTDWWQSGQIFFSRHKLVVPVDFAPGTYALRMGLHPFGRWEWLPVRGGDAIDFDNILVTTRP